MSAKKQIKFSYEKRMNELRVFLLQRCESNSFLSSDERSYWLNQIPHLPLAALQYLVSIFSDFDDSLKQALNSRLSADPEGVFWNKFVGFKKKQLLKLSTSMMESDSAEADRLLDDLDND
jgi:hypothetical protein